MEHAGGGEQPPPPVRSTQDSPPKRELGVFVHGFRPWTEPDMDHNQLYCTVYLRLRNREGLFRARFGFDGSKYHAEIVDRCDDPTFDQSAVNYRIAVSVRYSCQYSGFITLAKQLRALPDVVNECITNLNANQQLDRLHQTYDIKQTQFSEADIHAHSMGGLMVAHAVSYFSQLPDRVFMYDVPWNGLSFLLRGLFENAPGLTAGTLTVGPPVAMVYFQPQTVPVLGGLAVLGAALAAISPSVRQVLRTIEDLPRRWYGWLHSRARILRKTYLNFMYVVAKGNKKARKAMTTCRNNLLWLRQYSAVTVVSLLQPENMEERFGRLNETEYEYAFHLHGDLSWLKSPIRTEEIYITRQVYRSFGEPLRDVLDHALNHMNMFSPADFQRIVFLEDM